MSKKNPETLLMLDKLRKNGAKVFLLTNSDFQYSQAIMKHILEIPNHEGVVRKWTTYFDYIVTDARKPLFFEEGTILRVIDEATGRCSIGHHTGPLETGRIYAGGSCEVFTQLIRARGKDVLYTGDHIYGDILKSKKQVGWRTFLVIPELLNEIYVWKSKKALYDRLQDLDNRLAENYKNMDIGSASKPNVTSIQKEIRLVAQEMERSYGLLGSIFRSGSRLTFFSSQSMRYADIYSFSCINLIYYPMCYMFRAPTMLMPHESTVSHVDSPISSFAELEDYPCGLRRRAQTITVIPSNCLATSNLIEGDQPSKDDASALESADNL
uniref:Cytosolic purine 5'-nucleotidase n=1 Tax=Schistocephalus solidus TaxID=70667 RepID=A0A0X3PZM9_SCHSO